MPWPPCSQYRCMPLYRPTPKGLLKAALIQSIKAVNQQGVIGGLFILAAGKTVGHCPAGFRAPRCRRFCFKNAANRV